MRKLFVAALLSTALFTPQSKSNAQQLISAIVVSNCGTLGTTYVVGVAFPVVQDLTGHLCLVGGGGGGGGVVLQGALDASSVPWKINVWQGGSVVGAGNGVFVQPATGTVFPVSGTFWQTTQPVSVASPIHTIVDNTNNNGLAAGIAGASPVVNAQTSHASVSALGTSLLVKASAGNLFGYYCNAIAGAAVGYCIAYNSATVPATGALTGAQVLDNCYLDGTAAGCSLSRIPASTVYSNGIVILISSATTPFTYTTGTDTGFIAADFN